MAVTTVYGAVPGAARRVQMIARLVDELGRPIPYPLRDGERMTGTRRFRTEPDGSWRIDLEPNDSELTRPDGAAVRTLWVIARRGDRTRVYLRVPASPTPVEASTITTSVGEQVVQDRAAAAALEQLTQARAAASSAAAEASSLRDRVVAAEQRAASAEAKAATLEQQVAALSTRLARVEALPMIAALLK